MRHVKIFGLAIVAVVALSVSMTSVAAAEELLFNSNAMGNLVAEATETQVFTTSAGKVECTEISLSSGEAALKSKEIHVTVVYEKCKAFGLSASISAALYLFLNDGTVHIINPITISAGFGLCKVTVPVQLVSTVLYANVGNAVELTPEVTGIESSGTGVCEYNETGAGNGHGTYTGKSLVELPGGKIEA